MKCPKCHYLGFETGDRCKHCGYDFSLMAAGADREIDINLALPARDDQPGAPVWLDQIDRALGEPAAPAVDLPRDLDLDISVAAPPPPPGAPVAQVTVAMAVELLRPAPDPQRPAPEPFRPLPESRRPAPGPAAPAVGRSGPSRIPPDSPLPLFARTVEDADDEPLIRLPAAPRPPLAVRRTPDVPRLRAVPKPAPPIEREPELEFAESPAPTRVEAPPAAVPVVAGGAGSRLAAMAIDLGILFAIDAAVVYLTLRMAGLAMAEWVALPAAPLVSFLALIKLAYFCAFTAVGGQTIGKMAARIRVVTQDGAPVDGACAATRTLVGVVSAGLLGIGLVPALVGADRRAFHDRVTRTRVIAV
jgi:uncharacterized RDD family membrane protein YckC